MRIEPTAENGTARATIMVFTSDRVLQYRKKRMIAIVTGTMSINRCRTRRLMLRLSYVIADGKVCDVDENIFGEQSVFVCESWRAPSKCGWWPARTMGFVYRRSRTL